MKFVELTQAPDGEKQKVYVNFARVSHMFAGVDGGSYLYFAMGSDTFPYLEVLETPAQILYLLAK